MTKLPDAPLVYLITPGELTSDNFKSRRDGLVSAISGAAADGVNLIQIRERHLSGRELFELAKRVVAEVRDTTAKILVSERADIAAAAGAHGVHLPAAALPTAAVRAAFGAEFLIGGSAHSADELRKARSDGADLAVFSPIFDTPGKGPAKGLNELAAACHAVHGFPVIALGGIGPANFGPVLDAGAAGVAAIRSLNETFSRRQIMAGLAPKSRHLR